MSEEREEKPAAHTRHAALSALALLAGALLVGCSDAYAQTRPPADDAGVGEGGLGDGGVGEGGLGEGGLGDAGAARTAPVTKPAAAAADDHEKDTETDLFDDLLDGRCRTAICWDVGTKKNWLGIEPLVELPIGKSFTFNTGGVADYINNHDVQIQFTAGLRVWVLRDQISLSVYLSQPLTPRDSFVRIPGSSFEYPATYLRRPYPGIALGFLFDTLWLGLDRDELRNGDTDSGSARDAAFPRNAVVSSAWTWTVAIQPFTAFRTGIGTVLSSKKAQEDREALKKKDEELRKKQEELDEKERQIRALTDAGAGPP